MRIKPNISTLVIAACLGACGGAAPPPASPAPATESTAATPSSESTAATAAAPATSESAAASPKAAPAGSPMAQLMREHFKEVEAIRHAIIAGKPHDAVQPAVALSGSVDVAKLPAGWRPPMERMHAASIRVQNSSDLAEAAAGTADIGAACGACHETQGGPKPNLGAPPPAGDSVVSRMARHSWAMERLWEGIYVPSSAAWKLGAKALEVDPFPPEVLDSGGVYARSAAKDFKALAVQTPLKESSKERVALYAGLLGTCGTCHLATGRGK